LPKHKDLFKQWENTKTLSFVEGSVKREKKVGKNQFGAWVWGGNDCMTMGIPGLSKQKKWNKLKGGR